MTSASPEVNKFVVLEPNMNQESVSCQMREHAVNTQHNVTVLKLFSKGLYKKQKNVLMVQRSFQLIVKMPLLGKKKD